MRKVEDQSEALPDTQDEVAVKDKKQRKDGAQNR